MKKLLLILLCLPMIFSFVDESEKIQPIKEIQNNIDDNYTVEFKTDSTFIIQFNYKRETKTQLITHKFDDIYYPEEKEGYLMEHLTYDDWNFDGILDIEIYCLWESGSAGNVYDIWVFDKEIGQFEYDPNLSRHLIDKDDKTKTVRYYAREGAYADHIDTLYSGNKIYNSTFKKFEKDFID